MNRTTPFTSSHGRAFAAVFSAGLLVAASSLQAADQTYDATNVSNVWDLATSNWDSSTVVWTNGNNAIFGGTGESVAVNAAITVGDITFNSTGYTIANGSGGLTLANAANTITVTNGSDTATIAETIAGTGLGLIKAGAGTLTLSGANTYTGGTTISEGVLSINAANNLGTGTNLLNGGTLRSTGGANTDINTATALTIGANGGTLNQVQSAGTFRFQTANALLGSGTLTITGNGTLTSAGSTTSGVVVLNNSNTFSGNVILQNGGLLEYNNASGLAGTATITVGNQGGLSASNTTVANAVTLNSGSTLLFQNGNNGTFTGPITLNADTTIRMQDWYATTARNGTITGTITGAHTITVNSGNTNTGTGGTLTLGGFDAKASSADIILNGSSLALNSNSGTGAGSVTRANSLTINTGNLTVAGVAGQNTNDVFGTLNLGGGSSGNLQGYSTWTLSPNAATNTALTFTNMGTRTSGSWVALASTVGATPAANTANIHFTNGLSGSNFIGAGGSLASGTASVIPWLRDTGGNNIYGYDAANGVATVTTVNVNPDSTTSGQNINWNAASTLTANRTINSIQAAFSGINLGGNTLTVASGVITADNASFTNGTLDFGSAEGQLSVHQARTLTISANISGSGGLTFVGFRTNSGNAGRLILSGANTYTGVTNFYGYGAATADFYLTNSLALQNTTVNYVANRGSTLFFGNGGTSGQTAYTFGGLSGNANINLNNINTTVGAVALTVGGNNDSTTYSGVLSSTVAGGSLTKVGTGTLTLGGASTYTGATTVSNGTIALASAGSLASAAYSIADGATFNASAKSVYSLASVASTVGVGATTAGFFNGPTGALTLGNSLTLNFSTSLISDGQTYNLFDFGSQTGDFSSIVLTGAITGTLSLTGTDLWTGSDSLSAYNFTFNEATGNLLVNVTAVPEPATYALVSGLGILALAAYRRRRNA